jgi:hypothetical protein
VAGTRSLASGLAGVRCRQSAETLAKGGAQ